MVPLWFNNPKILLTNLDEFFPDKNLQYNNKINSLIRFSIYYSLLIIVFNYDLKYLYLSLLIIIISLILSYYNIENFLDCKKPSVNNPFMNYTLSDLINNNNNKACKYDDVKNEIKQAFRKDLFTDSSDIWGKYISDRNFYTMPNTDIINKQTEFAEWLYGDNGKCKINGECLKNRDPKYHHGRIVFDNEHMLL